jgi:hypothetical protein
MKTNCRWRLSLFSILAVLPFSLALLFLAVSAAHANYTASETLSNFGTLQQPAWPIPSQNPVGNPAFYDCTQTALVNAFVYLQNQYSSTYGTSLVPISMNATAMTLNSGSSTGSTPLIPTTWTQNNPPNGAWSASEGAGEVSWGTYHYVSLYGTAGITNTYFYAESPSMSTWGTNGSSSWAPPTPGNSPTTPTHASGLSEDPTEAFLYNGCWRR